MTPDIRNRLDRFVSLLQRWNATLNLVAPRDMPHLWDRHVEDSLQLVPLIPDGTERAVDLGSGGGFPGLLLAIATGIPFDLIESDRRKAAFLRTAILETGAPAQVHACRIEEASVPAAPLVTARALAPLPRLLPMVARFLAADGVCLLLKGAKAGDEVAAAHLAWRMTVETAPSRTHPDGAILRIAQLEPRSK